MRNIFRCIFYAFKRFKICLTNKRVKIGKSSIIYKNTTFAGYNCIGKRSQYKGFLGKYSYMGDDCKINANIGKFCSIASNVKVISATHPSKKFVSSHPIFFSTKEQVGISFVEENVFEEYKRVNYEEEIDCIIGNDVWIGENAMIMGGVTIGDGAIIAAGAVVTKDVENYTIVAGVPAKVIRLRFEKTQIDFLNKIKWWNKSEKWLKEHAEEFRDIEEFIGLVHIE